MNSMKMAIKRFWADEEGVTAIEYGLLAALIAVAIIAAVRFVGIGLNTTFEDIAACLGADSGGTCPQ